jgi:hypothetical protein
VEAMDFLDRHEAVEKTSLFGTAVHAVLRSDRVQFDEIARSLETHGIKVHSIGPVSPSLEDVFLDVVEKVGAA